MTLIVRVRLLIMHCAQRNSNLPPLPYAVASGYRRQGDDAKMAAWEMALFRPCLTV